MAKSIAVVSAPLGIGYVDAASYYVNIAGRLIGGGTVEDYQQVMVRDAGTFNNLFSYVITNTASVTTTITLQKSTADTALIVSYTSDQTGVKQDTSNSVVYAATDTAAWEITVPTEAGTNTFTLSLISCEFTPTNIANTVTFFANATSLNLTSATTTTYWPPNGRTQGEGGTEDTTKFRILSSYISQDLNVYVFSNARTTNTLFRTRVDGADGNQVVTYTSGQTGLKEDTSNTDTLSNGNDFNYSITTGTGTETLNLKNMGSNLLSTANQFQFLATRPGATGEAIGPSTTAYFPISGDCDSSATEADVTFFPGFTFTASNLEVSVVANTNAASSADVFVRDNLGDSSITVTYTTLQTGLKTDTSNTATITTGTDEINYSVVNADAAGTISFSWMGLIGQALSRPLLTLLGVGT